MTSGLFRFIVYAIKALHIIIGIVNTIAIPTMLIYAPWYLSIPISVILVATLTANEYECLLTRLENKFRVKAGMPVIESFIEDIVEKFKR